MLAKKSTHRAVRKNPFTDGNFWEEINGKGSFRYSGDIPNDEPARTLGNIVTEGDKILNLMCGEEAFIQSYLGLDIVEKSLRKNDGIYNGMVHDINCPEVSYPIPIRDSEFGMVLLISGIAYIREPRKVFRDVNRVLKPRGRFAIAFGNAYSPSKVTINWMKLRTSPGRLEWLQENLTASGFGEPKVSQLNPPYRDDYFIVLAGKV